jgi:hypothetical protein
MAARYVEAMRMWLQGGGRTLFVKGPMWKGWRRMDEREEKLWIKKPLMLVWLKGDWKGRSPALRFWPSFPMSRPSPIRIPGTDVETNSITPSCQNKPPDRSRGIIQRPIFKTHFLVSRQSHQGHRKGTNQLSCLSKVSTFQTKSRNLNHRSHQKRPSFLSLPSLLSPNPPTPSQSLSTLPP